MLPHNLPMCQKCTTAVPAVEYHEEIREYTIPDAPEISDRGIQEIVHQVYYSCGLRTLDSLPPSDLTFDRVYGDLMASYIIRNWVDTGYATSCVYYPTTYHYAAVNGYWVFEGISADTPEKRRKNIENRAKVIVRKANDQHAWKYDRFDTGCINWEAIGTDIKNKAGSIGKRVSKEVKRVSGHFLPDCLVETINNIAESHRSADDNPNINFDQGFIGGTAKEYCNSGSCWWTTYKAGREEFANQGGYAARLWRDGKPISRIMIIPQRIKEHDCHIIFNNYGEWKLNQWAETLAKIWGMQSKEISFSDDSDGIYVNGNEGYLLSPVPMDSITRHSIDIEAGECCSSCDYRTNEDNLHWSECGDGPYCEDCIPWVSCDRCGNECWPDSSDTIHVDERYFCSERCASREGFHQCYHCDEWKSDDEVSTDCDDNLCCDDCSTGENCHHCENRIASGQYGQEYVTTQEGNHFCENCQSEVGQCPHCEDWHETGEDTCPNCEDTPLPIESDVDASGIVSSRFISPDFICHTAAHPGIIFPEFAPEPLQVRPVESAIDEWLKPGHGRVVNAPLAILAINLCLAGF